MTSILALAYIAGSMAFQPGWANGLPISKHTVFAAVMSSFLFMMLMSAGAALFVFPCAYLERALKREFVGWRALTLIVVLVSMLSAILTWCAFPAIRGSIAAEWP